MEHTTSLSSAKSLGVLATVTYNWHELVWSGSDQMDSVYLWEQWENAFILPAACRNKEREKLQLCWLSSH